MKHKIFYLLLLIILVCITNKVSAQFVPFQSGQFKRLAADTLYNLTACGAPAVTPNSYRRVVWYYDSCNQINYYWQPENQVWATISGGGGGSGGGSVTAVNGLSNVNDSTIKWEGNLIENTHIRGDDFPITIDSVRSFIVSAYGTNRSTLYLDTGQAYLQGRGSTGSNGAIQLLPYFTPARGGSQQGVARLIGSSGTNASIIEVSEPTISFYKSGVNIPAKIFNKYVSDSLDVASPTKIAVWDSDTLKSADISDVGVDSIFITNTDSIFIIRDSDTIFVGVIDNIRDTADLVQGYGIYINNADSTYKPNGFDVLIAVDTSRIATKNDITIITNTDTAIFIVDSIANAPTGSEPPGTKYLVGTSPTGVFAGHANDVAELVGAVWTFTDPEAQQQLIVDNDATYATYQYNGATWVPTSILVRHNYNRGIGSLRMGTFDKNTVTISAWNKPSIIIDTTRAVHLPKFIGTRSQNYLKIDSLTGRIDTAFFRPLIAGTNITITPGPVGDTIKSSGSGGGGLDSGAYRTMTLAGDSSYVTFNRADGTKDTLSTVGGQTLNGTGYVKMTATTPSYHPTIPNTDISGLGTFSTLNSPATTNGDMLYWNGTAYVRIPIGTNGNILGVAGGLPTFSPPLFQDSALHIKYAQTNNIVVPKLGLYDTIAATAAISQWSPSLKFFGKHHNGTTSVSDSADIYLQTNSSVQAGYQSLNFNVNGSTRMFITNANGLFIGSSFFGTNLTSNSVATTTITGYTEALTGTFSTNLGKVLNIDHTYNFSGVAPTYDLYINRTETSTSSGVQRLISANIGAAEKFGIDNKGKAYFDATNTAGGTTGAQTINKPSGTVNFAAAATSLVVTNSLVTTSSIVNAIVRTNDANKTKVYAVVPAAGSFTIYVDAAPAAEISVGFWVIN